MNFVTHSFRHAEVILNEPAFIHQYAEITSVITGISDADLILKHEGYGNNARRSPMSISKAINELLRERLHPFNWQAESAIFQDARYAGDTWRLDFAKGDISIEVVFNHGEAVAWNLTKPVLASELNHVQKAIQTQIGIIITATESLKRAGGFDGAVGTYEKYIEYLPPMRNVLTVPMLIIGLSAPETFVIDKVLDAANRNVGVVRMLNNV